MRDPHGLSMENKGVLIKTDEGLDVLPIKRYWVLPIQRRGDQRGTPRMGPAQVNTLATGVSQNAGLSTNVTLSGISIDFNPL
jgi:hypothetical protein